MVKPYLRDIDVECWQHVSDRVGREPTICLYHAQIAAGQPLLVALDEVGAAGCPARRTVTFRPCDRPRRLSSLRFDLVPESEQLGVMRVSRQRRLAWVEMTRSGLVLVRDALIVWLDGGEDYGVSPSNSNLRKHQFGEHDLASGELSFWGPCYVGP